MSFQYTTYIWILMTSAAVTLALALYALRNKKVRGAFPFGICMLLTALWAVGNSLEMAGTDLSTKLFWANVQSISYSANPVLWLIMVFQFIERDHWITRRNILLLLAFPFLTVVLAWTNDLHGLLRQNVYLDLNGSFSVVAKTYGVWFWVIASYSYALNIISELLLAMTLLRKSALYREQSLALFIGLALLFIQNALYIFGIHPVSRFDLTPVAAGISGLIIAWGIFRYRLFDIVPLARENIIEQMDDGLIVLDAQNRIVDMNRTAQNIFDKDRKQIIGQKAVVLFHGWPEREELDLSRERLPGELVVGENGGARVFELAYSYLQDSRGKHNGMSVLCHNVTERKRAQAQLLEQQRALAISEERERLARELHDSLGQVLGYINVQAQAVREQIIQGQAETAATGLERLSRIAQDTHNDVREYIQSVRGIASAEQDFMTAVQNYLKRYNQNYGIKTELRVSENAVMRRLEPGAGRQLLRIIQEALANVRKHACADAVKITCVEKQDAVEISIEDNGIGFAREDKTEGQRFGLGIMEERAREAGGHLSIETGPGQGTKVRITIPRAPDENLRQQRGNA